MKDKRVVFMGTPLFAVPVLEELIKNTNVVLVVTQPDKPVGRHKESVFTPIKEVAVKMVYQYFNLKKLEMIMKKYLMLNQILLLLVLMVR